MSKIIEFIYSNKKLIIIISIISLLVISSFCFLIINSKYKNKEIEVVNEEIIKNTNQIDDIVSDITPVEEKIYVDIKGEVVNPGVYEIDSSSRVIDAINKAGGFTDNAYTRYLNLSKKLVDENVIIVNNLSEIEEIKNAKNKEIIIETNNTVSINENEIITNDYEPIKDNNTLDSLNTLVNINDASLEELTSLEGIGESTAKKIIEYRELNDGFKSIEELLNVDGIGESKYAKIKENITIK